MINIPETLTRLAQKRPIFQSEADFQHALAWQLHEDMPNARIRLEYRPFPDESIYLDIWIEEGGQSFALELKYPTCALRIEDHGEVFALRNHGAQDISRYDFIKDIARLERVIAQKPHTTGWAILRKVKGEQSCVSHKRR